MVHLITGYAGEEHIQSADQGSFNASFFGTGQYVMEAGNQMEASITSNNNVRILDGDILMMGRHIRIASNTYEDVNITTGTAGTNRNDLIVMEYSKDANSGVETAQLKVIMGVETEGTATDPAFVSGDILAGAILNQMPLYSVRIEGVVLADVVPLFETIPTYQALAERYRAEFVKACQTHLESLNILDTMEEVSANTQANQLAGALAVKEMNDTLIASDGTHFRFGFNAETSEYGYIVTDSEGADTFCPFSNAKKLYEALQYSGFVTEGMTFEEMCVSLAEYFPEVVNLLKLKFTASGGGSVDTNTETSLILRYKGTGEDITNKFTSEYFTLPLSAKVLTMDLTATRNGGESKYVHSLVLHNITKGTSQAIYSISEGTFTKSGSVDISAHAGCECYLQWTQVGYAHNYVCVNARILKVTQ